MSIPTAQNLLAMDPDGSLILADPLPEMKAPDFSKRLAEVVDRWQQVRRGSIQYREGSPEEQAKEFHFREVLPVIIEKARARWEADYPKRKAPAIMITMAGFSPETTIIAYSVLRPKHVFVVTSSHADAGIDRISQHLVGGEHPLPPSRFQFVRCVATDPYDIYKRVRTFLEEMHLMHHDGKPLDAIVDITGGKKVMSAAAALLAWRLNVPLCYIDTEFDEATRRPTPGSERLIYLNSPVAIYREEEIGTAIQVFNSGHYAQAQAQFTALAGIIEEPAFTRFMGELSMLYRVWCDLEVSALGAAADRVESLLDDSLVRAKLAARAPDAPDDLRAQIAFIRRVADRDRLATLLWFYLLGLHYRERLNRHDFAALLFYRAMEGAFLQRLESLFPGFVSQEDAADYSKVPLDQTELLEAYNDLWGAPTPASALPTRLAFANSAALLLAVEDKMLGRAGQTLGNLRRLGKLRNDSVLAHGYVSVSKTDSQQLQVAAERLLDELFHAGDHDLLGGGTLADACRSLQFLRFNAG